MEKINVEIRKTGQIVNVEGVMANPDNPEEMMYVFGLKVGNMVYKCHYTTTKNITMDLGDYASINGRLYNINLGFCDFGIVKVLCMKVITKEDIKNLDKDHIFIADFKIRGQELPLNVQNGFIINKKEKRNYGLYYVSEFTNKCLGLFKNQTELLLEFYVKRNKCRGYDLNKLKIVDFDKKKEISAKEFINRFERG